MEWGLIQRWAPPARLGHPWTHTWAAPGRPRNRRGLGWVASLGKLRQDLGSVCVGGDREEAMQWS